MAEQEFKIVKFGDSEIPVPSNLSVAEIKELLAPAFPRISSAHAIEENGVVKFFLEAGEKGSEEPPADGDQAQGEFKIVKFGDSEIPVPSNLSVAEIKELLAPAFPRISSAHAIEENGVVKFFLEAGEKGSDEPPADEDQAQGEFKIVKFGDSEIPVPSNLSVAEIKELLAPAFPRISSAHAIEENGVVKFFLEAGEKGHI